MPLTLLTILRHFRQHVRYPCLSFICELWKPDTLPFRWAHLKGSVQRQKNMGGVAALPPRKFSCLRKVFAHCYLIYLFYDPFVVYAWKMCRWPGKFADYLWSFRTGKWSWSDQIDRPNFWLNAIAKTIYPLFYPFAAKTIYAFRPESFYFLGLWLQALGVRLIGKSMDHPG